MSSLAKQNVEVHPTFASRPAFILNPSGLVPLAGVVTFNTTVPTVAEITVSDGDREWPVPTETTFRWDHRYVVLGMRSDRAHKLNIRVKDRAGHVVDGEHVLQFRTAALPRDFPPLKTRLAETSRIEPGVTFFGIRKSASSGAKDFGVLVGLDETGEVVWYRDIGYTTGDIKRLQNGNLIYLSFDHKAIEIDMLGNIVHQWAAGKRWPDLHRDGGATLVDAEAFHHEIYEMPNDHFLVLSIESREFGSYPSSETDPGAAYARANVVGDVVTEFRRDGSIVDEWHLLDILDPLRIGFGSLGGYWVDRGISNSKDWSHANAVIYDDRDDSLILSLRHQDAVIKIGRADHDLKWILGTPDGWQEPWSQYLLQPEGAINWQYHQHNCTLTPDGNILLFDNGNFRARPFADKLGPQENYSRVVEFAIDEENMTVREVWSYGSPGPDAFYCPFICGAGVMAQTGNILACFGGMLTDRDGLPGENPGTDTGWVRLVEVTRDEHAPEKVFELFIDDRTSGRGWDVYRADRMPSLYG